MLQATLFILFIACQVIFLFTELRGTCGLDVCGPLQTLEHARSVIGFDSLEELVNIMIALNITTFVLFLLMLIQQYESSTHLKRVRIRATNEPPEIELPNDVRYHLFVRG